MPSHKTDIQDRPAQSIYFFPETPITAANHAMTEKRARVFWVFG
jgi:hypothetical protein